MHQKMKIPRSSRRINYDLTAVLLTIFIIHECELIDFLPARLLFPGCPPSANGLFQLVQNHALFSRDDKTPTHLRLIAKVDPSDV